MWSTESGFSTCLPLWDESKPLKNHELKPSLSVPRIEMIFGEVLKGEGKWMLREASIRYDFFPYKKWKPGHGTQRDDLAGGHLQAKRLSSEEPQPAGTVTL